MKRTICGLCLLALCWGGPARGEESLLLEEITVRGASESPRDESLSMREVRESPARDLGEALRQIEGIDVVRKGAIAADPVLRGLQKDNINVFIDGVRLHGACPSRMDPPSFHYDFAEVEQVRIVKGPYDLSNPGGLGGMIDVVTRQARRGFGSDLSLTYGSYESVNASATASYGGERFDGLFGYAYKYSGVPESGDGRLLTDIFPSSSPNRYRLDARDSRAYEINTGWFKLGIGTGGQGRSELGYSYQDARHVLYPYLKMDADYDRTQRLNWSWQSDLPSALKLQLYWDAVRHLMDDRLRVSSLPGTVVTRPYSMRTDARTEVFGLKAGVAYPLGGGTWRNGLDYYNRNWNALNQRAMFTMTEPYRPLAMIPDVATDNLGAYSEYRRRFGNTLQLSGGARIDQSWVEAERQNNASLANGDRSFTGVGANLQATWTASETLELFAGVARATRPPDAEELFIDVPAAAPAVTWRGNPQLDAPVNHQADLGLKFSSERLFVSGSLFYSQVADYIDFGSSGSTQKSYRNIDARLWGGELGTQISLPFDLFVRGNLAYTEGRNEDADRPLAEIPPLKGVLALRYDNGQVFVELAETMTARQRRVDSSLNERQTPGWAVTDLKGGVVFGKFGLQAGINNLFDKHYFSHLSYQRDPFVNGVGMRVPENGRNLYLTASYNF